jgi:hypothetical protein
VYLRKNRGAMRAGADALGLLGRIIHVVMYARAVDDAAAQLQNLRRVGWQDLALAAVTLILAVVVTQIHPPLALPLLLGGVTVGGLGIQALWRRWDIVERLSGERDAYVIAEVLAFASREATMERRHGYAESIRSVLEQPESDFDARSSAARQELDALASELDDGGLELDPACAVACARLLRVAQSPLLLTPAQPPEELCTRIRQIRFGFHPRRLAA